MEQSTPCCSVFYVFFLVLRAYPMQTRFVVSATSSQLSHCRIMVPDGGGCGVFEQLGGPVIRWIGH